MMFTSLLGMKFDPDVKIIKKIFACRFTFCALNKKRVMLQKHQEYFRQKENQHQKRSLVKAQVDDVMN